MTEALAGIFVAIVYGERLVVFYSDVSMPSHQTILDHLTGAIIVSKLH